LEIRALLHIRNYAGNETGVTRVGLKVLKCILQDVKGLNSLADWGSALRNHCGDPAHWLCGWLLIVGQWNIKVIKIRKLERWKVVSQDKDPDFWLNSATLTFRNGLSLSRPCVVGQARTTCLMC